MVDHKYTLEGVAVLEIVIFALGCPHVKIADEGISFGISTLLIYEVFNV